jgi:hypothetical protein
MPQHITPHHTTPHHSLPRQAGSRLVGVWVGGQWVEWGVDFKKSNSKSMSHIKISHRRQHASLVTSIEVMVYPPEDEIPHLKRSRD